MRASSSKSTRCHFTPSQHIIWDWNGTLLDDAWLCVAVMNEMLARRGMPLMTRERYRTLFDFPVEHYYRRLGFDFQRESFEALGSEFMATYERRRHECSLQPAARDLLACLQQAGCGQSLLSAYKQDRLVEIIATHGLSDCFRHVIGLDDHYAGGKIHQGLALLKRLNHPPGQTILIGDTTHDHEVARAMGIRCILVDAGNQPPQKLAACNVPCYPSLRALLEHVQEDLAKP